MGKGDRKTAKGKRYNASYGNARPKAEAKAAGTTRAPVVKKATATKTVAKAPAKKVVAKKTASKE
jgi:30S ribosomal protein S31